MPDISITEIKMRELRGSAVVRSGTFTAGAHVSSLVGEAAQHRQRKKRAREREKADIHVEYYTGTKNKLDFCFCL